MFPSFMGFLNERLSTEAVMLGELRRRQIRLILAGKMKPDDAEELKALFLKA